MWLFTNYRYAKKTKWVSTATLAPETSLRMQHAANIGRMLLYIGTPTVPNASGTFGIHTLFFSIHRYTFRNPFFASAAKKIMYHLLPILPCFYIWKAGSVALAGKSSISTTLLIHLPEQKS